MPLARYFLFVGGVLLSLLFVADACLPKMPAAQSANGGFDPATIRIHSDRKWPERVVFDTSQTIIVPARTASAEPGRPTPATAVDISATAHLRDSFAQLQPSDQMQAQQPDPKKPEKKLQPKRRVAKRPAAPPMMLVAQQPPFGIFGRNTW